MTGPTATCELWVDGVRVPDTGPQLVAGHVAALSSLSLTWGRDGANEQPGPATSEFTVLDPIGDNNFLDVLHVGSTVAVWAEGHIPGGADRPTTFDNGSFTGRVDGPVPASDAVGLNGGTLAYVSEAIKLTSRNPASVSSPSVVQIPPRVFSPTGTLPDAWDDIPQAHIGETWKIRASVKLAIGQRAEVLLVAYVSPYPDARPAAFNYTRTPSAAGSVVGTGVWQDVAFTAKFNNLSPDGVWLGIDVRFTGDPFERARWENQDPALSWAAAPGAWNDFGLYGTELYVDNLAIYPPPITVRRVLAFSGAVSDIRATPGADQSLTVAATAADLGAELGNRVIGDTPWPAQAMSVRAARIVSLAALPVNSLRIDSPLGSLVVSYRDVDAQATYALLQDLAQTVGGVLWGATHAVTGPYLWIENPAGRAAVRQFSFVGSTPTVDATNLSMNPGLEGGALSGWNSANATLYAVTLDTAAPISGARSALSTRLAATPNTTAATFNITGNTPTGWIAISNGVPVSLSFDLRAELANRQVRVSMNQYDASGVFIQATTYTTPIAATVAGQTQRVAVTITPNAATAARGYLIITVLSNSGNATTGERVWVDNLRIGGPDYFDGDTPPSGSYTYRWTGTARASTSERLVGGGTIQIIGATGKGIAKASACDILLDPVEWRQATEDVITVVAVTWQEQTLDDDGLHSPTERTYTASDAAAIATYGTRRLSISTELTTSADAAALAARALAQARAVGWRLDGITIDTAIQPVELSSLDDATRQTTLLDLLDGTIRMGAALTLVDMPSYAPRGSVSSVYVEGGKYEFEDGYWRLALTTTPSSGVGSSATWADFATKQPAWQWRQWDPALTWTDAYGTTVGS